MNKAKIEYKIDKKGNLKGEIKITFAKNPSKTLIDKLKKRGLISDGLKVWKGSVNKMSIETYNKFHDFILKDNFQFVGLSAPYMPGATSCVVLDTIVPDSMDFEIHAALQRIKKEVGGSLNDYVADRLEYTKAELCDALAAEQVDAVAIAIYNIEFRNQALIVGDQTGIGKGRVAAAMVRYACKQGLQPIFLTEKPNLFSDIYRDLVDIGSSDLVPFIVNGRESKTHIKDINGNIIYEAPPKTEQERIFEDKKVPGKYNYICATYSQFNSPENKPAKPLFLLSVAKDNILIMDESHNASGSSNTGEFLQAVVEKTRGATFLSATFAKRPDNMPIYAMKTAISDANMSKEDLVIAIQNGGVALQEIMASQLVEEGQMIRRERSFDGIEVNYITLSEDEAKHKKIADSVTEILRDIIGFQSNYVDEVVKQLDEIAAAEGKEVETRKGTSQAGVDNQPYFSKVFNVINQMLFSIKAERVADLAIKRLKEGKKPVIAFASTMGSFLEQMENDRGVFVGDGDIINADFTEVLKKGLDGILRYTEKDVDGTPIYKKFSVSELDPEAQTKYFEIEKKINKVSIGISISPIDVIVQKIEQAGFKVAEVTGRRLELQLNQKTGAGLVLNRKKINVNDAFRKFNNNKVDVLMINQSGSTGASAHAIITDLVPRHAVKQRVMIVLQAELDINREVQKRGRINRTGQIYKPIYDYVNSAIPAEKRLMMMLQKKLKSLDANTTSSQKQSKKVLDVDDFLNKYGDKIVADYLIDNPEINEILNDPIGLSKDNKKESSEADIIGAAHKVSGRVAVLSTIDQEKFYNDVLERYTDYVDYLKQTGDYDLEVETLDLRAETLDKKIIKVGKGGSSAFGDDSILEKLEVNILKKPYTQAEIEKEIKSYANGKKPDVIQLEIIEKYINFSQRRLQEDIKENNDKYKRLIQNADQDKRITKIKDTKQRISELEKLREQLRSANIDSNNNLEKSTKNKEEYLVRIFKYFYIGRGLNYPRTSYDQGEALTKAIFLGFVIQDKKNNPYAPSAIKLRIAIANSDRYIVIPASFSDVINAIIGASVSMSLYERNNLLSEWNSIIKDVSSNRGIRYMITGNILQAFSSFSSGKLVSYSLKTGGTSKGILLPESYDTEKLRTSKITVPIIRAIDVIKSMYDGGYLSTTNGISIVKRYNDYRIIVNGSKKRGGFLYLDQDILKLVNNNNFDMISGDMVAVVNTDIMPKFIKVLNDKLNTSVELTQAQFDNIKDSIPKREPRKVIKFEPKKQDDKPEFPNAIKLKIKAKALKLKLQLLNLNVAGL